MRNRYFKVLAAGALALLMGAGPARAAFPDRPVQIVLGFGAGSSIDNLGRLLAEGLRAKWGQSVVVENRPGAGGNLAADMVAKSAGNGHVLLLTTSTMAISPSLYKSLSYNPLKDLVPVTQLSSMPHALVANKALGADDVPALIALARRKPGVLTFGSAGIGNSDHMAGELFKSMTGVDIMHVPYKGGQQAMIDVIGGTVDLYFSGLPGALPMIASDKVKALGTTGTARSPALPAVPAIAETVPGYAVDLWYGVFAPSSTPSDLVETLARDIAAVLATPAVRAQFDKLGVQPVGSSPSVFQAFYQSEYEKWKAVIERTGLSL